MQIYLQSLANHDTRLACFNLGPPEPHLPFTPGHFIHGAAPLGRLYGTQLRNQPGLSNLLKDTIHECLYEIPANRASLLTLKTRIRTQLNVMTLDPAFRPEGNQDIECPEPITEYVNYPSLTTGCGVMMRHLSKKGGYPCPSA